MAIETTVRFFIFAQDENNDFDVIEVTERCFNDHMLGARIQYDRHTVHHNGINQICLTLSHDDTVSTMDLESV